MRRLVGRAVDVLREEGPRSLLRSARWYLTASRAPPPFATRPEWLRRYVRFRRRLQPGRFSAADPIAVLWVDPARIETAVRGRDVPLSFGRVAGGDWDASPTPFDDLPVAESVTARVREGRPWAETPLYDQLCRRASDGRLSAFRPTDDVESRLRRLDGLVEHMREEGYRSQAELLAADPDAAWAETELSRGRVHPRLNEIGVNVGRDGTLHWRHRGKHRLAIARALELDAVAVQVLARHSEWEAIRRSVRDGGGVDGAPDGPPVHPDLRDLLRSGG